MTFTEYLRENTIIAWIILAIFIFAFVLHFGKLLIIKYIRSLQKARKEKAKTMEKKQIVYKDRFLNSDLVEIKNADKKEFYYKADKRDYFVDDKKGFIRRYLDRRLRRKYPDKVVLIRMEMDNGSYREFLVREDEKNGFKHQGKKYIFDLDAKYFVVSSGDNGIWAYDFHESFTLPVKRRIPVNDLKDTMEQSNITEVENAVNPVTLERFIKSEIAQGILQGATIGRLFKVILILLIITTVVIAIDFLVDLFDSGIIQNVLQQVKK